MHDDIVRILSPLLVVAAMAAMQMAQPALRDGAAANLAGGWTRTALATSCHGTRLGNNLGSACATRPAQL